MRSIFSTLFLIICFSAFGSQQAVECDSESAVAYKKLYLDSEKVAIHDGRILLYYNDTVLQLNSLFSDEKGLHLRVPTDSWWTCICGWEYPDNVRKCQNPSCIRSQ